MKIRKKPKNPMRSVRTMETYIQIVESEVKQFMEENGFLLTENTKLKEANAILYESSRMLIEFILTREQYDGEAFKQYVLTIENERLQHAIENMSNLFAEGVSTTIMVRPEKSESPYNETNDESKELREETNKPIIFEENIK